MASCQARRGVLGTTTSTERSATAGGKLIVLDLDTARIIPIPARVRFALPYDAKSATHETSTLLLPLLAIDGLTMGGSNPRGLAILVFPSQ